MKDLVIGTQIDPIPVPGATVDNLLHRLWTKAVGTKGYDKREWKVLNAVLLKSKLSRQELAISLKEKVPCGPGCNCSPPSRNQKRAQMGRATGASEDDMTDNGLSRQLAEALTRTGKWHSMAGSLVAAYHSYPELLGTTLWRLDEGPAIEENSERNPVSRAAWPVLTDPATQGCLWAIVRERWPDAWWGAQWNPKLRERYYRVARATLDGFVGVSSAYTPTEALARAALAALEGE